MDVSSSNPHYLALVIWYQQGMRNMTAVQLCETQNFVCNLLDWRHGTVWTTISLSNGPLSVWMVFSDEEKGEETWVVPVNNMEKHTIRVYK
ncbi:Expansin B1 [Spatholobus suberectus]|nr:Expansin B1 [Spatholobus suberectus]